MNITSSDKQKAMDFIASAKENHDEKTLEQITAQILKIADNTDGQTSANIFSSCVELMSRLTSRFADWYNACHENRLQNFPDGIKFDPRMTNYEIVEALFFSHVQHTPDAVFRKCRQLEINPENVIDFMNEPSGHVLVRDIINNKYNNLCPYKIYDENNTISQYGAGATPIYNSELQEDITDEILNRKVTYMMNDNGTLIIDATLN